MKSNLKQKIAIALKYTKEYKAPKVIAKGRGVVAENIIETAKESGVVIKEDSNVANSLFQVEMGDEIPEALYMTVATILSHIYELNEERKNE